MKGNGASYSTGADSVTLISTGVEAQPGADEGVEKMVVADEVEAEVRTPSLHVVASTSFLLAGSTDGHCWSDAD